MGTDDKVYKNQDHLRIHVDVGVNISGAACRIKYQKEPDFNTGIAATGSFPGTIMTAADGTFYYDLTGTGQINEAGNWTFWGRVTWADGRAAPGDAYQEHIYEEGE